MNKQYRIIDRPEEGLVAFLAIHKPTYFFGKDLGIVDAPDKHTAIQEARNGNFIHNDEAQDNDL